MTDATASPVEAIKAQLSEAEAVAAGLREQAEAAANALVINPSRQLQVERDELVGRHELISLTVEKLKRDLAEARESARRDRIQELVASQGPIQERAGAADDAVWRSLGEHEQALAALLGCRQELKKLNAQLAQLGYEGGAIQPCPRPQQNEYRRRTEGLVKSYNQATHPLGVMPVRMSE